MTVPRKGPFSLNDPVAYARWRDAKLANFPSRIESLMVEVKNLAHPAVAEIKAIQRCLCRAGMAIYQGPVITDVDQAKGLVQAFGEHFGLKNLDKNPYADEDAITLLRDAQMGARKLYIPYTKRALNWHTDGYYNPLSRPVRSMMLHCVEPAERGGENIMFDPEIAYVLMRESDPRMIEALFKATAMTIPSNDVDDKIVRNDVSGAVFSVAPGTNELHMRYTARKRHVLWADDAQTVIAVDFLRDLLEKNTPGPDYKFSYRLGRGEGLICKNILHGRRAFENLNSTNGQGQRMMLRARYLDAVDGTAQTV